MVSSTLDPLNAQSTMEISNDKYLIRRYINIDSNGINIGFGIIK